MTLIVLGFVLVVPEQNIPMIALFLFFVGVALSALQIIPMSLLPDVIDIDEYENNIRREGAFNGMILFLHKASSGLAVGGVGMLIELFGYTEQYQDNLPLILYSQNQLLQPFELF